MGGSWHPLHSALIFGELEKAKTLVSKSETEQAELLNHANDKGWRAIHFASHSGSIASVKWLLELSATDQSARTSKGETALHLAAARGDEAMSKALLQGGCPADCVTKEGKTALHVSSELGHLAVTRLLVVGAGLSPSTPDGGGASAAALALAGNHKDVLRLLQKSCPGVSLGLDRRRGARSSNAASGIVLRLKRDGGGRARGRARGKGVDDTGHRLLKAAREGDTVAMGEILARGDIEVDWVGRSNGWTAVMEAAEHGSLEGVCYLVDKGADLERSTNKGLTPLQLAVRSGFLGVTEELLRRGARPGVTTKAGLCLRCLADSCGHRYLLEWLFYMGVADGEDGHCACSGGKNDDLTSKDKAIPHQQSFELKDASEVTRMASPMVKGVGTAAATTALTEWLTDLRLGEYESRLVSQGFDTVEAMGLATEEDLEDMGFKKGHLRRLLAYALPAASTTAASQGEVKHKPVGTGAGPIDPGVSSPDRGVVATNIEEEYKTDEAGVGGGGREDEDRENGGDDENQYCDASALDPMRTLSMPISGGDRGSGGGGVNGLFKELRPEEVEVGGVIGEGSFGVVKRGRWRGMDVAVKELKTCIASAAVMAAVAAAAEGGIGETGHGEGEGDGRVSRTRSESMDGEEEMRHEARMLAKVCNHACVVQFVGVLLRPVPSVVTKFMEKGSVEALLVSSDKPATKKMVVRMAIEAAKGVIHLHREGVVHRDLASRNLLLDDAFHVRISDFGFSRVKRECMSRGYTRSDMGPIKWTSPEAMRKRCYSEASDAFSFGVVLFEIFSRSPPWEGHENLDVAYRVCSGERMAVPPSVDALISSLMWRCWDPNPRQRPDFASILAALTEYAADPTVRGGEALVKRSTPAHDGKPSATVADMAARAKAAAAAAAAAVETEHAVESQREDSTTRPAVERGDSTPRSRPRRRKGVSWRERRKTDDRSGRGDDRGDRSERPEASNAQNGDYSRNRRGGRLGGRGGASHHSSASQGGRGGLSNGSAPPSRSSKAGRGRGRGGRDV